MLWCAKLPLVCAQFVKMLSEVLPYPLAVTPGCFFYVINKSELV